MTASNLTWQRVAPSLSTSTVESITHLQRAVIDLYAAAMQHTDATRNGFSPTDQRPVMCQRNLRVAAIAFTAQMLRAMPARGEERELLDQCVQVLRDLAQAEQEGS